MTTAIVPVTGSAPLKWGMDREQIELLKRTVAKGTSDDEFSLFMTTAQRMGLDPFARQIHAVMRWDSDANRNVMAIQVGIDGYRSVAHRTGEYDGQDAPMWCGPDGIWRDVWLGADQPMGAKVLVYRKGISRPFTGIATFKSYAQRKRNGDLNSMWSRGGDFMLSKCFDEHTEVLTDRGFEKFDAVEGRILQVTASGLSATDAKSFFVEYSDDMITLDSDDLNFCVTPNHDMVTTAGKIEAGAMMERARTRPAFWIPRITPGSLPDADIDDRSIALSAVYLADGYYLNGTYRRVAVSRAYKLSALRDIGGYVRTTTIPCAGDVAVGASGREVVTQFDKIAFDYSPADVHALCDDDKRIDMSAIMRLSRRQARIFVDTLVEFDGSESGAGVRRFYTSRPDHASAFELAAVIAGYSVSAQKERFSDLSDRPNFNMTISERDAIPVRRWGRVYKDKGGNERGRTGLEMTKNTSGRVWCVTVPSGVIVVRRHGFSMLCGNCAEAVSLRKGFPSELSGTLVPEELGNDAIDAEFTELPKAPAKPTKTKPAESIQAPSAPAAEVPATAPVVATEAPPTVAEPTPAPVVPPAAPKPAGKPALDDAGFADLKAALRAAKNDDEIKAVSTRVVAFEMSKEWRDELSAIRAEQKIQIRDAAKAEREASGQATLPMGGGK